MTRQESRPSRRTALGLLGAVPFAASGVTAASGAAQAATGSTESTESTESTGSTGSSGSSGAIPADLRPGGAFGRYIKGLLTHTGGMTDPTNTTSEGHVFTSIEERTRDIARRARTQTLRFTPGTGKEYSSMGYEVLGELVATVSGLPFHEYVREHVFKVAGMHRSAYHTRPEWLADERIAHPYMLQEDGSRVDGVRNLDKGGTGPVKGSNSARAFIGSGGGNGFSTAPDLVRFALALQKDELLKRAHIELYVNAKVSGAPMREGLADPARGEAFHAYGPTASVYDDRRYISHGGGVAGGSTNWSIYLDIDWVAVVLCNYDLDVEAIITQERRLITA
ncbi:serine hydrolase domain-containing protein [Nonomuraea sp. NPDC050643]|uniref:serine hydrolase domain-containing protein n=1 Tax=Nonomuraea sp. NPDC050643 TaxID=3155660 RepID=UPI0033D690C3